MEGKIKFVPTILVFFKAVFKSIPKSLSQKAPNILLNIGGFYCV